MARLKKESRGAGKKASREQAAASTARREGEAKPVKTYESAEAVVFDNFLPEKLCHAFYEHALMTDYRHINTTGKVSRAWNVADGFPLRSVRDVMFCGDPRKRRRWASPYPVGDVMDKFVERLLEVAPQAATTIGRRERDWDLFSATLWLYPSGTGLSLHNDGAGVYTGAYVYFLNPIWRWHWGGLLLLLDQKANALMIEREKSRGGAESYHKLWLHEGEHDELAMGDGFAQCIFPKRNRLVFIAPEAFHFVTKVHRAAGDHVRMSAAGFFHAPEKRKRTAKQ